MRLACRSCRWNARADKRQFIVHQPPQSPSGLQSLLEWIERRLDRVLTLEAMAEQARVSIRTLTRRFQEQLGVSPLQWVLQARVRRAQHALETTDLSIERVAASPVQFIDIFARAFRPRGWNIAARLPEYVS